MGVPVGPAMSIPVCGLRGSLLKIRRKPYELERIPGMGCIRRNVVGGSLENVPRARRILGCSRLTRARSFLDRSTLLGATFRACVTYFLSTTSKSTAVAGAVPLRTWTLAWPGDTDSGIPTIATQRLSLRRTIARLPSKVTSGGVLALPSMGRMRTPPGTRLD